MGKDKQLTAEEYFEKHCPNSDEALFDWNSEIHELVIQTINGYAKHKADHQTDELQKSLDHEKEQLEIFKQAYRDSEEDLKAVMLENRKLKQVSEQMAKALEEIKEFQMNYVQLARTTKIYNIADDALEAYNKLHK